MKISIATNRELLDEVYRFRYTIYVEEMNRTQRYADETASTIVDPLDEFGHVLVAHDKGELVGTLRLNLLREGDVGEYLTLYGMDGLSAQEQETASITTRLMIAKSYRSGSLAVRLSKAVFDFAYNRGVETDYIDCNPPLDEFFAKMGYRELRKISHPEYGDVVVMRLNLRDRDYLASIGSPFVRARKKPNSNNERLRNVHSK